MSGEGASALEQVSVRVPPRGIAGEGSSVKGLDLGQAIQLPNSIVPLKVPI
jgi:hypothetical protein